MKILDTYDVVVIGGGINGAGIAADAAGRGLSVLLCEQGDLACATSSASTKLIHGGLRYLEQYDFSLVRSALVERKILAQTAPHLVRPLRFILPFKRQHRPFWILRLGLLFYDFLALGSSSARAQSHYFENNPANPLKRTLRKGLSYSDCVTDDARLVIHNALRAHEAGATIATHLRCLSAQRVTPFWELSLQHQITGKHFSVKSQALVNATGPWVNNTLNEVLNKKTPLSMRMVKGSHIVLPSLYEHNEAYLLQHKDGRVIFVIPYCQQFTMVGTTEIDYNGDPMHAQIEYSEMEYLCAVVNDYFHQPVQTHDIISAWSGVRPLIDEGKSELSTINRGYYLNLEVDADKQNPLINIFGGKLTTYRILAEQTVNLLKPFFNHCQAPWTAKKALPGGALPCRNLKDYKTLLSKHYPWLPPRLLERYMHSYGTRIEALLHECTDVSAMGRHFGHGLYEREVTFLIDHEWAMNSDDILWRRTKLGLLFQDSEKSELDKWINQRNAQDV